PADVDCNVHPTKIEVRLRRSSDVYRAVLSSVERALRGADLTPRFRPAWSAPAIGSASRAGTAAAPPVPPPPAPPPLPAPAPTRAGGGARPRAPAGAARGAGLGGRRAPPAPPAAAHPPAARLLPGRFVQLLRTYVATAAEDGLLIFDQHALHERVLYRH